MKNMVLILCYLALSYAGFCQPQQERPASWAQPANLPGVSNAYSLDTKVYRSAQPGEKGFEALAKAGFTDVLCLRQYHNDKSEARKTKLNLHRIPMNAAHIEDEDIISALKFLVKTDGKILIHCWHGSDRTGVICAMYRIIVQNWTREEALEEFLQGGFGYHSIYKNIPEYIESVDLATIRKGVFETP